jgi:DNA invertase Pin-like site-specific DNA recombinase
LLHDNLVELSDEAISATNKNRPGFQSLITMINNEEVDLVIVDDESRLTRELDLGILWNKMSVHDCRFISVLDGIDSIRESDELPALFKGIMNNVTNKLHGKRVRRGIAGRALDMLGSAGYHPFGYGTRYCDPEVALNYSGVGGRPKKEVFIDEAEAATVREIFRLFAVED